MATRPIITLTGVTKNYGMFTALHKTDLELAEGEFVTLLGPSGCGKTTTLRLVGGFEEVSSGRISVAGQDVTAQPPYRRPVNTVFQDYALFPHMTVAENVAYGLSVKSNNVPRAERASRVEQALALVGLEALGSRQPGALSGGQRQRVAMARAIIRRPRVLLLDEPLSALDVKLRESMQTELKRLHRELGITFLMVTHDQDEALALSDRIVVMNQGRIVQIGAPTELYDKPKTPYVADFIGASNLFDATFQARTGDIDVFHLADGSKIKRLNPAILQVPALAKGARVQLGIRPERLRIDPVADASKLNLRLVDTLFHGDRVRHEFALKDGGKPIFADVPRTVAQAHILSVGAVVGVHVAASDVMVFPEVIQ